MAITLPTIDFPWNRKKTRVAGIELPHIELPRIDAKSIERAKSNLPKVDTAKIAETSAATLGAAAERAGQIGQEAGKISREIATSGEANLRSLGADLRELSRDVRSLRITRQKQGPDVMPGIALLAGLGGGLAAMYFFDPEQGRRRRALFRDQMVKWSRIASETISGRAEDLRNRTIGVAHETRKALEDVGGGSSSGDQNAESGWGESVVDTTPNAAGELDATDAAAGTEAEPVGVYSTGGYDPSLTGDEVNRTQGGESEQMYGSMTDTVREAWGTGEPAEEGRREGH